MEETIISFKTAKLAKEKGFVDFKGINYNEINSPDRTTKVQEFTFYRCYDKNPIMNHQEEAKLIVTTVGSNDIWGLVESYLNPSYITQTNYLAPTQSLLQKWIRETYNIDIESRAVRFAGDEKSSYYQPYYNGSILTMKKFDSYEEALEEGLYQALLLI